MSDINGKEREQAREGQIKNDMIDRDRPHLNYDLVQSELNLYQRAKERVDQLKSEKKQVQKNSVITYSNIITITESNVYSRTRRAQSDGNSRIGTLKNKERFATSHFQVRLQKEHISRPKMMHWQ